MRYWISGTIVWLAFWTGFWKWSGCSYAAPGISFDISCAATGPTSIFTLSEFATLLAEIALLPPVAALLAVLAFQGFIRARRHDEHDTR